MDRIEKFMRKLAEKQRMKVRAAYDAIRENRLNGLDVKPLQGKKNCFRCRVGDVRILFVRISPSHNIITDVEFRDKAYRRL